MWQEHANCKDMDLNLFFPEQKGGQYSSFIREVCEQCPVIQECLWFANETSADYGFFGGMSPEERRVWRRTNRVQLGDRRAA